jgi:hypothetical protein
MFEARSRAAASARIGDDGWIVEAWIITVSVIDYFNGYNVLMVTACMQP